MPHQRERFSESEVAKALTYSPCVGILGMRQVGKSTLIKKFSANYHSFDDDAFLRKFEEEKTSILELETGPVALDEIQKHPPAFDALKFSVDRKKRMGRFLISGSVRFSSRKQIRESLTGRIVTLEILPLGLAECHERGLSPFLKEAGKTTLPRLLESLKRRHWVTPSQRAHYFETGGLPGICFRRDPQVRTELFEQHIDTLLRRDIQLVRQVRLSYTQLKGILTAIAAQEGQPTNFSQLGRLAGCSTPTVKTALEAMEGMFLARPYGKSWFVEDAGLARHLGGPLQHAARLAMLRTAYHELRLQHYFHLRHDAVMKPYSTRGGIDVPFFFEFKDGDRLAVLLDASTGPSEKSLKSVTWMRKKFPRLRAFILTEGDKAQEVSKDCAVLPFNWIF